MQGQGMAGERLPLCFGVTQWPSGDKVTDCGSNETPRTGRGVGQVRELAGSDWPSDVVWPAWLLLDSTYLHTVLPKFTQFCGFRCC